MDLFKIYKFYRLIYIVMIQVTNGKNKAKIIMKIMKTYGKMELPL